MPQIVFLALAGRSYQVLGNDDSDQWTDLVFSLTTDEKEAPLLSNSLFESYVRRVEVEVPPGEDGRNLRFFNLKAE